MKIGDKVKVIASKETLPGKSSLYAGQFGTIIRKDDLDYYIVRFSNDDTAAYLAKELKVVK